MEENKELSPLFGSEYNTSFQPYFTTELSPDTITQQVLKLEAIPDIKPIIQEPVKFSDNDFSSKFNFPINGIPKKEDQNISLQDSIHNALMTSKGNNYGGEVRLSDAIRYNDPLLGIGKERNNEDLYSEKGNFWNTTNKVVNGSINWTKAGMYSLKGVWDAAINMDADKLWDNDFNKELLAESEGIQYLYPIYKSKAAQDNPSNIFATGNFAESISNVDMIIGTVISTVAQDLAIAGASALAALPSGGSSVGVGTGALIANTGKNIANVFKNINLLSKITTNADKMRKVAQAVNNGESLVSTIKAASSFENLWSAGKQVVWDSLRASGEAGFEAASVAQKVRKQILENNPDADINQVNEASRNAGLLTYGLNQAILNVSNSVMYGKLLSGKLTTNTMKKLPFEIKTDLVNGKLDLIKKEGFWSNKFSDAYIGNKYVGKLTKDLGSAIISEGAEEGLQYSIEKGIEDFYKKQFSGQEASSVDSVLNGLKSLHSEEGLANIFGGMLIGGGMSSVGTAASNLTGIKSDTNYKAYKEAINQYQEAFKNTSNLFKFASENLNTVNLEGKSIFEVKNEYDKLVHDFALFGIKQGNIEARIDALKEFKLATPEEFTKYSGIEVKDQSEISDIVDSITNRIKITQDSYNEIQSVFGVNPFNTDDVYREKIENIARRTKQNERRLSAILWENAKDQAINQLVDLKTKSKRDKDLTDTIYKENPIEETNKALFEEFINNPIRSLNSNANLNEQMGSVFNMLEQYIATNQSIVDNLPDDLQDVLLEKQQFENTKKFYDTIRTKFEQDDLKGFYQEFYKYLTNQDSFDEDKVNQFILDTTDLINLRFGKKVLSENNTTLRSKKGIEKLVKENLSNLGFYTYVEELKAKVEKGELQSISVNGEITETPTNQDIPQRDKYDITDKQWEDFKNGNLSNDILSDLKIKIDSSDLSTLSEREKVIYDSALYREYLDSLILDTEQEPVTTVEIKSLEEISNLLDLDTIQIENIKNSGLKKTQLIQEVPITLKNVIANSLSDDVTTSNQEVDQLIQIIENNQKQSVNSTEILEGFYNKNSSLYKLITHYVGLNENVEGLLVNIYVSDKSIKTGNNEIDYLIEFLSLWKNNITNLEKLSKEQFINIEKDTVVTLDQLLTNFSIYYLTESSNKSDIPNDVFENLDYTKSNVNFAQIKNIAISYLDELIETLKNSDPPRKKKTKVQDSNGNTVEQRIDSLFTSQQLANEDNLEIGELAKKREITKPVQNQEEQVKTEEPIVEETKLITVPIEVNSKEIIVTGTVDQILPLQIPLEEELIKKLNEEFNTNNFIKCQ